ncbi:FAD-dependent oxidoreductase [Bradyrhizobium yuanmingense]|nr:FAD-dependent oxidoreductase [Bradyrhizobium yuanmingense]
MVSSALEELSIATDVLVVGGGMAGAWAATSAAEAGAKVVLVDKGYCGTSGVTAAAGPGHWWVPPDPPAARDAAVANRVTSGLGLGEADWMYRILDQTWRTLPTLARYYKFGVDDEGRVNYRAVRGPEYMRALRQQALGHGVTILDHSPVLELLARSDGSIGGARGQRRQDGGRAYRVEAGAVVLGAGGTSFLSHLLGSQTNTGDGYLLAAEAGAEVSGMEFTAAYTIAPAHSTMTRSMAYSFATYYDAAGRELDLPFGPDQTLRLARALQRGPVYCSLHRLPDDIKARLHTISPNVPLVFDRWGIDPYRHRFEVTLHNRRHHQGHWRRAGARCGWDDIGTGTVRGRRQCLAREGCGRDLRRRQCQLGLGAFVRRVRRTCCGTPRAWREEARGRAAATWSRRARTPQGRQDRRSRRASRRRSRRNAPVRQKSIPHCARTCSICSRARRLVGPAGRSRRYRHDRLARDGGSTGNSALVRRHGGSA